MRFVLEIDCDNAALRCELANRPGGPYREAIDSLELLRLLSRVKDALVKHDGEAVNGTLQDVNGNTVGRFGFDDGEGR